MNTAELGFLLKEKRIQLFKEYKISFRKYRSFEENISTSGLQNTGNSCYLNAVL